MTWNLREGAAKITLDINELLSGTDWQRLETWAALADMTPLEYVRACVRRGHLELRAEVVKSAIYVRPASDKINIP